jgi:predicted dehydrogenase
MLCCFTRRFVRLKSLSQKDKIGQLHYIYSTRLNFGTVRTEESVFWSFAPHDISILNYLAGGSPVSIEAKGSKFLQDQVYDVTMAQLEYPGNHTWAYLRILAASFQGAEAGSNRQQGNA